MGLFIWAAACGVALKAQKRMGLEFADSHEALTFASGLGLGLLAYAIFALGALKLLAPLPVAALLFFLFVFSFRTLAACLTAVFKNAKPAGYSWLYLVPALVVLVMSLAGTLAQPIGQDELCYHLVQPKNYLRAHAIYEVPYSSSALWPYLMEMLFTLGLLLKGPALAKFFHFAMTATAVSAVYCFTKRAAGPKAAFFAALVFLTTPAVFIQSSFAYVDNGLACYSFLAFYAFFVYSGNHRLSWSLLAGLMAGFALSVKFIGLFMLPLMTLGYFALILRASAGRRAKIAMGLASFLGAAIFLGGLWYVRAAFLRGNPVFPFYPQFFGGNGWQISTYVDAHGKGQGVLSFLTLLWDTALHPQHFGGEHIGPFYLALVPLVFLIRPWPACLKYCLAFGSGYAALWFWVDPNIRFFFPALAFFSPAAGIVVAWLLDSKSKLFRACVHGVCLLLFVVQASFAVYHFKDAAALWFGADRERYVDQRDRSFGAAKIINRELKAGDKLISVGEVRGYYFDAPFVIEGEVNRFTGYGNKLTSVSEVRDFLKKEGFTHVLYRDQTPLGLTPGSSFRLPALFEEDRISGNYFRESLIVRSGKGRYVLYKIL